MADEKPAAMPATKETDTGAQKARKRWKALYDDARDWRVQWSALRDYILPWRGAFLDSDTESRQTQGATKSSKIINPVATRASEVLASGLMSGLTSRSRPWFRLGLHDRALADRPNVKAWLTTARDIMLHTMAKSNFYGATYNLYQEVAAFGYNAMLILDDPETVIRCFPTTIGEAYVGVNDTLRPSKLYRKLWLTAEQMVQWFGIDRLSISAKAAYERGDITTKFLIIHAIEERPGGSSSTEPKKMPWSSVYFEDSSTDDTFLLVSGFPTCPFCAPRWDVVGTDIYGGGPGLFALADVKQLQAMEKDKIVALDKMVNPPMNAPASLRSTGGSVVPGAVNYVDTQAGMQGFTPAYQVNPDLNGLAVELQRVEDRIGRTFYVDLFLTMTGTTKRMTATEVDERREEKLVTLGPVIQRLQDEFLEVVVDRVFDILLRKKMLPPIPAELADVELKVEYISPLAQAQKAVAIGGVQQLAQYVAGIAPMNPDVLDKMDFDESIDQYADMLGVPPGIIRSDEDVAQLREQRAQQQAQMQQMAAMQQQAETAKTLGDTPLAQDNVLGAMIGGGR